MQKPNKNKVYIIRGKKVMLAEDMAELYGVLTSVFVRAVLKNISLLPDDFRFQLSKEELENLLSQRVSSNASVKMWSSHPPYVFTVPSKVNASNLASILNDEPEKKYYWEGFSKKEKIMFKLEICLGFLLLIIMGGDVCLSSTVLNKFILGLFFPLCASLFLFVLCRVIFRSMRGKKEFSSKDKCEADQWTKGEFHVWAICLLVLSVGVIHFRNSSNIFLTSLNVIKKDQILIDYNNKDSDDKIDALKKIKNIHINSNINDSSIEKILLIASISSENKKIQKIALDALNHKKMPSSHKVDALIGALKDENKIVRVNAAKALGNFNNEKAIEVLTLALNDINSEVSEEVKIALKKIKKKQIEKKKQIALLKINKKREKHVKLSDKIKGFLKGATVLEPFPEMGLCQAIRKNQYNRVKKILGTFPELANRKKRVYDCDPPLVEAIRLNRKKIIRLLKEVGAEPPFIKKNNISLTISKKLIAKAQKRLKELGYSPGTSDGIWGKKTKMAVIQYQKNKNLSLSGKLDDETLKLLRLH